MLPSDPDRPAEPARLAVLDRFLDDHRGQLLALAEDLVAVDSQIPPYGDEVAIVGVVRQRLRDLGLPVGDILAADPDRPNLVATLPGTGSADDQQRGGRRGRRLMLSGHLDTKPVGPARDQWRTDPLVPEVMDGILYGLGTADMKAACAAMIMATHAVREAWGPVAGDVTLALLADEEAGSRFGARYVAPLIAARADACLIGEPGGWQHDYQALHLVSRGLFAFMIEVRGTQLHSSLSDRMPAVNATVKLAELITDLDRWTGLTYQPHPLGESGPTLNVGVLVEGGVSYGTIAGRARFGCDLRALPGMTPESILVDLRKWLDARMAADPDLDAVIIPAPELEWIPPSEIAADHPLVATVTGASDAVLGRVPPLSVFPGATDAPWFDLAGLPTIPSFGPGVLTWCHGPNEHVAVTAIEQAAKLYARSIVGFCS
ncbi:acetylornithine deacetylase [Microlunatus endophyticus]|uniref:Acetylornithine deacetylase n=1 Tax=Microlunatus endophyticus TaxID=1716077 RepID=A0A917W4M6_9ACTN|nr:M20/M25/M40 family metallo-hydrolase [Microlunatus endophyticus]GGL62962.1 acetylornithine deacetylase [Microlunatus endophyticus]